jgi:hypothetical protein
VQAPPQKKRARAYRIEGSLLLYRSAARRQLKAERLLVREEPWWGVFLGLPLFLKTLLRMIIACAHRHKGPPITVREAAPSNLRSRFDHARGTYITCLDCGKKFAYDHKARRMIDYWGIHDPEARAEVQRKIAEFILPLQVFAARFGGNGMRNSMRELARSVHRLGLLMKGH